MRVRFVIVAALIIVFVAVGTGILGLSQGSGPGREAAAQPSGPAPPGEHDISVKRYDALVILSTLDLTSFHETLELVRANGGEVPQAYPPNAFVATLNANVELALRQQPAVARIERGVVDPASLTPLGGQAETAAYIWNTVFRGVPDPIAASAPSGPPPERQGPDFLIPPPEVPGIRTVPSAPSSTQTSEFMAGTVIYSVVFVESSGGTGNCSPPDAQTENWSPARQSTVLSEISQGLAFWTARSNRASPLSFVLDNWGTRPTSCEPITRTAMGSTSDEPKWVADVLTAMGFPATTSNYLTVARAFAHARRTALGADWGFIIFIVDSLNDADGNFSDGSFAYAYLNGPFMVMTYDNDGWGIGLMNLVTAHETGHTFGALDEYAASECSTSDTWGYLNVANASCNNGGITTDKSIMGEGSEEQDASVDVSTSARGAIGWRNPGGSPVVVDVVRTATVSLTAYTPDPTSDNTPTYSAIAGNTPYPPGGCNTVGGTCCRTPSAVTVSRVAGAEWNLDGGAFTSSGVTPTDGAFDEESDPYTFTPQSPVSAGTHTFGTRSTNSFGHQSSTAADVLTISGAVTPTPTPGECTTYTSSDVPKSILDLTTVTSTLNVGDSFTLADVNAGPLNITHTWDSDLDVFLVSPQGTRVELFTDVGSSGDNFTNTILDDECATSIASGTAPFTGCYQPEGSLADFDGESSSVLESPPNGIWTLEITDDAGLDAGTLQSWQLQLCGATPTDADGDGCTASQEAYGAPSPNPGSTCSSPTPCYSDSVRYDFFDVPAPVAPDPAPSGVRNRVVDVADPLAVLFYAFTESTGLCGDNPNGNGVDYDCDKGMDTNGDTVAEIPPDGVPDGRDYDRTASQAPNPPLEAGPPNGIIDLSDALAALAQFGLDCRAP